MHTFTVPVSVLDPFGHIIQEHTTKRDDSDVSRVTTFTVVTSCVDTYSHQYCDSSKSIVTCNFPPSLVLLSHTECVPLFQSAFSVDVVLNPPAVSDVRETKMGSHIH